MDVELMKQELKVLEKLYRQAKTDLPKVTYPGYYPEYPKSISNLMCYIESSCWDNPSYDPSETKLLIKNIALVDWVDIASILTWCSRGERFCDGHWVGVLEEDIIGKVIQRCKQLLESAPCFRKLS